MSRTEEIRSKHKSGYIYEYQMEDDIDYLLERNKRLEEALRVISRCRASHTARMWATAALKED